MIRLQDLQLFLRSAALGGFSEAAREADILPSQVSSAIKRLEKTLGVRLFARSTRSLRLTAEGERFLPYARSVFVTLRQGKESLLEAGAKLTGTLLIALASDLGRNVLLPWLSEFQEMHPGLVLRLSLSDRVTDIFRQAVDVAIRYGVSEEADYFARPLVPGNRRVLCAAPTYLAARGIPAKVEDLADHDCLLYEMQGRIHDKWTFTEEGRRVVVHARGPMQSDDADVVRKLAVRGRGILYKSWLDVADDVLAGRLVVLLPHVIGESTPLSMVCPHRADFSPAIRVLHEWLRDRLEHLAVAMPTAGGIAPTSP